MLWHFYLCNSFKGLTVGAAKKSSSVLHFASEATDDLQPVWILTQRLWCLRVNLISVVPSVSCPLPHLPPPILQFETKASPEVKVRLVESDAESSVETARCSVRKKHLELQVCNSRPMRSMCHDDDGIYRLTLLYMNLAQTPVHRMQDNTTAHCNLFISPQLHRFHYKVIKI